MAANWHNWSTCYWDEMIRRPKVDAELRFTDSAEASFTTPSIEWGFISYLRLQYRNIPNCFHIISICDCIHILTRDIDIANLSVRPSVRSLRYGIL